MDFEKMYMTLFNALTDVVYILQKAQKQTEELYMVKEGEKVIPFLPREKGKKDGDV